MILYVTDLHFNRPWFDWVRKEAARTKAAVAISGDLIVDRVVDGYSQEAQADWVAAYLKDFPQPAFVSSGNHDLLDALETPPKWLLACGRPGIVVDRGRATHDGAMIACCPQDASVFSPREFWVKGADILLHHEPPYGYPVSQVSQTESLGSPDVADFIEAAVRPPSLILSGHVEGAYATWSKIGSTVCLNIARHAIKDRVPPHGWIDWRRGEVRLHVDGQETVVALPKRS